MIMYMTTNWSFKIEEKEVDKVSDKFVFYARTRERISNSWHKWHKTKEEAIEYMRKNCIREIEEVENDLSNAKEQLEEFELMYPKTTTI